MKHKNRRMRVLGLLLGGVLLLSGMPAGRCGNVQTVRAAGSSDRFIDVEALDTIAIAYGLDGKKSVQKVYFGASKGESRTWYIAGSDGEKRLVLFCDPDKPLKSSTPFSDKEGSGSPQYENSDLRSYLTDGALNENFTSEEQELMLNTKIDSAFDDKLYAANGALGETFIKVGSKDTITVNLGDIPNFVDENNADKEFWLRTRSIYSQYFELYADTSGSLGAVACYGKKNYVPAFALDLSKVLFASAAPAATPDAKLAEAVTFRFDGNDKIRSTAAYTPDSVMVNYNSIDEQLYLYVQGMDTQKDQVYAKKITGSETISVSEIDQGTDLSACKIWLEKEIGNVAYAKEAKEIVEIPEIAVTDITPPEGGQQFNTEANCSTTGVSGVTVAWKDSTGSVVTGNADYGKIYTAVITLEADTDNNYAFAQSLTATVNGESVSITENDGGSITITYDFTTSKAKLIRIAEPDAVTDAANGAEKTAKGLGLPENVTIETEDPDVTTATVAWNMEDLAEGSYDPAELTEQTFKVKGTVTLPDGIENPNNVTLTVTASVTVKAAEFTAAPVASPAPGTYTENKEVSLNSDTEEARIYYTMDESDPDRTNGIRYTKPIAASGTPGEEVTIKIKAIAVKDGMQDSSVAEFIYTIALPKEESVFYVTLDSAGLTNAGVKANKTEVNAKEEIVTVTITPDSGYAFDAAPTVKLLEGDAVVGAVTENEDGTYDCEISNISGDVTITVSGSAEPVSDDDEKTDAEKAKEAVKAVLSELTAANDMTQEEIVKAAEEAIRGATGKDDVVVTMEDFSVTEASETEEGKVTGTLRFEIDGARAEIPVEITIAKTGEKPGDGTKKVPTQYECRHEYEWAPEKDATTMENAQEVYQCKYCGRVKERMDVANSAYAKFNKDAVQTIDKASVNGTVTISTPLWVSFHKSVIETLKGRPDVTVVLNYRFKGERYTLTIPAGADLDVLEESEGYYGFRYLDTVFAGRKIN